MGRLATVLLVTAVLSGQAAFAQTRANPAIACLAELAERQPLSTLSGKVALGADPKVSLELQAIGDKPTADEKVALSRWEVMRDTCYELGVNWMNEVNTPRWIRAIVGQSKDASDALISQLYRGELTYGEFNVKRMALAADVRKRIDEGEAGASATSATASPPVAVRPNTLQEDQYRCEQEAARSFPPNMVQRMTSPGVQAAPPPTQTNCTQYGNQISCQSGRGGIDASIYNRPPTYVTQDANAQARAGAVRSCMLAKGYTAK